MLDLAEHHMQVEGAHAGTAKDDDNHDAMADGAYWRRVLLARITTELARERCLLVMPLDRTPAALSMNEEGRLRFRERVASRTPGAGPERSTSS